MFASRRTSDQFAVDSSCTHFVHSNARPTGRHALVRSQSVLIIVIHMHAQVRACGRNGRASQEGFGGARKERMERARKNKPLMYVLSKRRNMEAKKIKLINKDRKKRERRPVKVRESN